MDCKVVVPLGADRLAPESTESNESTSDDDPISTAIAPIDCIDQPGVSATMVASVLKEEESMVCTAIPSTSTGETTSTQNESKNIAKDPYRCPSCNCLGEPRQFRKSAGRPRKGQLALNRWLWKLKCLLCDKFFGDTIGEPCNSFEYDDSLYTTIAMEQKKSAEMIMGSSTRNLSSENLAVEVSTVEKSQDIPGPGEPTTVETQENTMAVNSKKGGRQRQTVRKNTLMVKSPIPEAAKSVQHEEKLKIALKTKVDASKGKKRPAENTPEEGPPSKIANVEKEMNSLISTALSRLGLDASCDPEPSELLNESLMRAMKVNEMMKITIERMAEKNDQLKSALRDVHGQVKEIGARAKNQMGCVRAAVEVLAKELNFFKNEVVSEARSTNEQYKKRQEELLVKYGFREMERDMAIEKIKLSEEKLKQVRKAMRDMGEDMARMENEIRHYEELKKNADTGKYMKCQSCTANEVLITRMRGELVTIRREKNESEKRVRAIEKQTEMNHEHVRSLEVELKRQTFLARSYEAMDKQNRAREMETGAKATPPTPKLREERSPLSKPTVIPVRVESDKEKKRPETKKPSKEEELTIPALSDIVDPEILKQAEKMANVFSAKVKMPERNSPKGNLASLPENLFSTPPQHKPRPDSRHSTKPQTSYHRPHGNHYSKPSSSIAPASFSDSPWEKPLEEVRKPEQEPIYSRRIDWASYLAEQKRKN